MASNNTTSNEASTAKDAVFVKSVQLSKEDHPSVAGPDFISLIEQKQKQQTNNNNENNNEKMKNEAFLRAAMSLGTIGFQATNLARAGQELFSMINGRQTFANREHTGSNPLPPIDLENAEQQQQQKPKRKQYKFDDFDDSNKKKESLDDFYQVEEGLFNESIWKRKKKQNDDDDDDDSLTLTELGLPQHCTIFVGCTANLFASCVRESLAKLAKDRLFDILVVSGGAFELDLQRALDPTSVFESSSSSSSSSDFQQNYYTYGNVKVARKSEKLDAFLKENVPKVLFQKAGRIQEDVEEDLDKEEDLPHRREGKDLVVLSPEQFWTRLARLLPEYARESSVLWQCVDNGICVYSPSLADGNIWSYLREYVVTTPKTTTMRLSIDLTRDITKLNKSAVKAKRTGMIILGGGVVKHHICNANLMRNGADHSIFINSAQEFDGSDAGARPDEAISWGKIKQGAKAVKVYSEVAAVFPLLCTMTFGEVLLRRKFANSSKN